MGLVFRYDDAEKMASDWVWEMTKSQGESVYVGGSPSGISRAAPL